MIKLTKDEIVILRNLTDEWKWIARDGDKKVEGDGSLNLFDKEPGKTDSYPYMFYSRDFKSGSLKVFNHIFQGIQFKDGHINIKDLLEEIENGNS